MLRLYSELTQWKRMVLLKSLSLLQLMLLKLLLRLLSQFLLQLLYIEAVVEAVVAIAEVTGQKLRKKVLSKYFPVARKMYCLCAAATYVGMVVKFAMPKCLPPVRMRLNYSVERT